MNNLKADHSSPANEKRKQGYTITIGNDHIRVISVFVGTKPASKAVCDAAIKKILYDRKDNL